MRRDTLTPLVVCRERAVRVAYECIRGTSAQLGDQSEGRPLCVYDEMITSTHMSTGCAWAFFPRAFALGTSSSVDSAFTWRVFRCDKNTQECVVKRLRGARCAWRVCIEVACV